MRWFNSILVLVVMTLISPATEISAQEISFWEKFALSEDRDKTLEELVPGSEDYYFFNCLHAQNSKQLDEADSLLKRWIKRHGKTQQVRLVQNRQALLKYGEDPKATLDFLKKQLGLDFNHQRRIPRAQKDLPTKLNPNLIDPAKLVSKHLRQDTNSLVDFKGSKIKGRKTIRRFEDPHASHKVSTGRTGDAASSVAISARFYQ